MLSAHAAAVVFLVPRAVQSHHLLNFFAVFDSSSSFLEFLSVSVILQVAPYSRSIWWGNRERPDVWWISTVAQLAGKDYYDIHLFIHFAILNVVDKVP